MKINIKGHDYDLKALKEGLNNVTKENIKFSFSKGRKIEMNLQYTKDSTFPTSTTHTINLKFNEILDALEDLDIENGSEADKFEIKNILINLRELKDLGHEKKSFRQLFYSLFRRSIPNWDREKRLNLLDINTGPKNDATHNQTLESVQKNLLDFQKRMDAKASDFARLQEANLNLEDLSIYQEMLALPEEEKADKLAKYILDVSLSTQKELLEIRRTYGTPPSKLKEINNIIYNINRLVTKNPHVKKELLNLLRSEKLTPNLKIIQAAIFYLNGNDSDKKECFKRLHPGTAGILVMHLLPPEARKEALEHCNLSSITNWVQINTPKEPFIQDPDSPNTEFVDSSGNQVSPNLYINMLGAIYRETPEPDKKKYFGDLKMQDSKLSVGGEFWLEYV